MPPLLLPETSTSGLRRKKLSAPPSHYAGETQALWVTLLPGAFMLHETPSASGKAETLEERGRQASTGDPRARDEPEVGRDTSFQWTWPLPSSATQLWGNKKCLGSPQRVMGGPRRAWLLPEVGWHQLLPTTDQDVEGGGQITQRGRVIGFFLGTVSFLRQSAIIGRLHTLAGWR